MKTLIYKGFGMENEGWISFEMGIDKETFRRMSPASWSYENPDQAVTIKTQKSVLVSVKTSDQSFNIDEHVDNDGYQRVYASSDLFGLASETSDYAHCQIIQEKNWPEEVWFPNQDMVLSFHYFDSIIEAISWIKEIVSKRREYWKTCKGEYNRLVAELRELTIEDFLDESAGDEITLSQTVKRARK